MHRTIETSLRQLQTVLTLCSYALCSVLQTELGGQFGDFSQQRVFGVESDACLRACTFRRRNSCSSAQYGMAYRSALPLNPSRLAYYRKKQKP